MQTGRYVQYGSGLDGPEGWINFDCSPTLRLQRVPLAGALARRFVPPLFARSVRFGDVVRGLPVANSSCDGVFCSHVLEHLSLQDFRLALKETRRILRPGGVFRLVMPDLRVMASEYLADSQPRAAVAFVRDTHMGREKSPRSFLGILRGWIGNAKHLWLWDFESTKEELADLGFESIRRARFQDSSTPAFRLVEKEGRYIRAFGIECFR